ncbi:Aquaporin [Meloidogyne graminicola]|uniref:Aquaporin n=1 Tax=Meloidogyne graminicola TaxID=189291 RepID=A0A8S9Z6G3_9BILA|nr:Aquaporin [Meloidogyne graminicola]
MVITTFNVETLLPAIIAISYYAFVFFFAEISRKLVGYVFKKTSLIYVVLIELIGTAQMCTCVYENSLIIKHYGPVGFFFVVSTLLLSGNLLNRGALVNPLPVIEQFFTKKISSERFLALLTAQTIGGYSAFRFANSLWYYSLSYSVDHHQLFERLPCTISYKVPFNYVFFNEIFCAFILRFAINRMPYFIKTRLLPFIISGFLTFSLVYIGIPGLNPVVASSRLMGCPGLDLQWFMITYWLCPVIGWMLAVRFDSLRFAKKKQNRKKNE